jgi:hypothetical protein
LCFRQLAPGEHFEGGEIGSGARLSRSQTS